MMRGAAFLSLLILSGCATTSLQCRDLDRGDCDVTSTRLLTDSSVGLTTPDGLSLVFSSKPNEAGTAAAFAALSKTVDGLLGMVKTAPVVP